MQSASALRVAAIASAVATEGVVGAEAVVGIDETDGPAPVAELDFSGLHADRKKRVVGVACAAGVAIMGASLAIRCLLSGGAGPITFIGAVLCVAFAVAGALRHRSPRFSSSMVLVIIALGYPLLALQAGGFDAPVLLAVPMVPILVVPFAGARGALALTGALVAGALGVWLAERAGIVAPTLLTPTGTRLMRGAVALVCVLTGTWMATAVERERRSLEAKLVAQARALYEASVRDPLTHLYNRRHLAERLAQELAFASRHRTSLSVILLDIDLFKRINDELGHAAGDEVLVAVSERLQATVRREDLVARHGGEEFAILLRGLDIEGARTVAERIRLAIAERPFAVAGQSRAVAISAGCASLAELSSPSAHAFLAAADERLYEAKRTGRNRVVWRP